MVVSYLWFRFSGFFVAELKYQTQDLRFIPFCGCEICRRFSEAWRCQGFVSCMAGYRLARLLFWFWWVRALSPGRGHELSVHMIDIKNAERKKRENWLSENKNMRGISSNVSANQLWNQFVCKFTETSCRVCPRCKAKTKLNEEKKIVFFRMCTGGRPRTDTKIYILIFTRTCSCRCFIGTPSDRKG